MKPIKEMSLSEISDWLKSKVFRSTLSHEHLLEIANRTQELHSLTRWIPVGERMPTIEDGNVDGWILVKEKETGFVSTYPYSFLQDMKDDFGTDISKYEWRRIDTPEGV